MYVQENSFEMQNNLLDGKVQMMVFSDDDLRE